MGNIKLYYYSTSTLSHLSMLAQSKNSHVTTVKFYLAEPSSVKHLYDKDCNR